MWDQVHDWPVKAERAFFHLRSLTRPVTSSRTLGRGGGRGLWRCFVIPRPKTSLGCRMPQNLPRMQGTNLHINWGSFYVKRPFVTPLVKNHCATWKVTSQALSFASCLAWFSLSRARAPGWKRHFSCCRNIKTKNGLAPYREKSLCVTPSKGSRDQRALSSFAFLCFHGFILAQTLIIDG